MRWALLLWRWSWIVTAPIVVAFVYWVWATANRFETFVIQYNPAPVDYTLWHIGHMERRYLVRTLQLALEPRFLSRTDEGPIRTINLFVPESNLAQLNERLPHSGFEYVEGGLWNGNEVQKVKIRYRGDHIYHWANRKKSLRVKTRRKKLFEGLRSFNLLVPKSYQQINTYLGYRLAGTMGLITPRSELVELAINGSPYGLHVFTEQLEELTLRRHGLMPGDIYVGEIIGRDIYSGVDHYAFSHPGLWGKAAVNNHYDENSRKPLARLIQLVNQVPTEDTHNALSELLDMRAWGRFSAFESLVQSFHFDESHNWRLYYDPWRSKFVPIVWDPLTWAYFWLPASGERAQAEIAPSRLHEILFKNGDFMRARQKALVDFFRSGADGQFLRLVRDTAESLKPVVARDPNLLYNSRALAGALGSIETIAKKIFADLQHYYLDDQPPLQYAVHEEGSRLALKVDGRGAINRLLLHYRDGLSWPIDVRVRYRRNSQNIERRLSAGISVSGSNLSIEVGLLARYQPTDTSSKGVNAHGLRIKPAYYELLLDGIGDGNQLLDVLVDRGGERPQRAQPATDIAAVEFVEQFPLVRERPAATPVVWKGIIEIHGVQQIDEEVVIQPGTEVRLSAGATLILNNRLIAEGSAQKPIRFLRSGKQPWGALVLNGPGASGSRLSHCELAGGSGLKGDLFEYSAMLSVHDVEDVHIDHCRFRDNQVVDDMLHAVYSNLRISESTFTGATSDALDLDISHVVIEGSSIRNSGNDAVDLMSTQAVIVDSTLAGNGDKGISVGEASQLLAINNRIAANSIGVQSKDGSVAVLYNVDLTNNELAVDAYKKNWRYGAGGRVFVYNSRVIDNEKMMNADKRSEIRVYDSYLDRAFEAKRVSLDPTVDTLEAERARERQMLPVPDEVRAMTVIEEAHWDRVRPTNRGATSLAVHN